MALAPVIPLATAASTTWQAGDFSWWQAVGGTLAVFSLLLLCLRLLGRLHRPTAHRNAALLEVWNLGPRREIQIVRLRDQVHYIYRHESALVLLDRQEYNRYRDAQPSRSAPSQVGLNSLLARLTPLIRPLRWLVSRLTPHFMVDGTLGGVAAADTPHSDPPPSR